MKGATPQKPVKVKVDFGNGQQKEVEPCITRLRVEVSDQAKVDEEALRAAGAFGVVRSGRIVQVVVGPTADTLASEIASL